MSDGVIAYFIDGGGRFDSIRLFPHDLKKGGSYEWEAFNRTGADGDNLVIIPMASSGNDWAIDAVARLKAKALEKGRHA